MPGNSIKINGSNELEWYVGDSQMGELISTLDMLGSKTQDGFPEDVSSWRKKEVVPDDSGLFTKEELQKIRQKAEDMAGVQGMNPSWVEAYAKIADACDKLDSMMVEEVEKMVEEVEKEVD